MAIKVYCAVQHVSEPVGDFDNWTHIGFDCTYVGGHQRMGKSGLRLLDSVHVE